MNVRLANIEDMPVLLEIYARAREFMKVSGNPDQWKDGTPSEADLLQDIEASLLHVIEMDNEIQASFVYYQGVDPCYQKIYDGAWLNDDPYAVLHRVATRGLKKHMGQEILDYAFCRNTNVRIDTHEKNIPMQNILLRNGFVRTGTILLENKEPRWAYQWIKPVQ